MASSITTWTPAVLDDEQTVLALMRDFYVEEKLSYFENQASHAVAELLSSPSLGVIFLCREGSEAQGYIAGTLCYSLEYGGRYVLLDELYLRPAARGQGEGRRALACIEAWALDQGVSTTRLEVNQDNEKALAIYIKSGFSNDHRHILSKRIA